MTMNKMQAAARKLHALGFKTLPIRPGTKIPATEHGVKDATDSDEATDAFYSVHGDHGIAIAGDGFVIFDFDVHDGVDGRDALTGWKLPDTLCQTTPSGGYHMIYRTTDEIRPSVNSEIAVDVRGWHSYVVCDPTPGYCWEEDLPIADANDAVMAFLAHVRPRKATQTQNGTNTKLKEGQGRNQALYAYGASLQSDSKPDEDVRQLMFTYNQTQFDPPLENTEFNKCLNSVLTLPKGHNSGETKPKNRRFKHADVADQLITENGACFVDGMPAIRHGNVYKIGWEEIDREIIAIDHDATRANQREVQHYLNVMAEHKTQSRPTLIAFANGVLDIETMILRDYSPDDIIPNIIPWDWNEGAIYDDVDAVLLKMACGDWDIYESLIEVIGVCMYRSSEFCQSAILLGDGSNGKSTFIRMLMALLGKENISTISMTQIGKQFLVGRMAGKLANLGSEISNEFKNGDLLATFKELVDGNRMHADVKGVEGFDFENYATLVMCANEFPRLADATEGMMRRLFPIEFNARFRKTDPDYDPRIVQKVTNRQACERMAALGVEGLKQVFAHNGFTPNASTQRKLEEIKTDNDTALAWALDMGWTAETLDGTSTAKHYGNYKEWCVNYGYQYVSHKKFTALINRSFGMMSSKVRIGSVPINCFKHRNNIGTNPT